MTAPPIAFYAPLKSPNHDTPSGDRRMARLFMEVLTRVGLTPELASEFRSFLKTPDPERFERLAIEGEQEAMRLIDRYAALPLERQPKLWFTYHLYYKAPDHLGPRVAAALGIPYVVAEASRAPKRLADAWAPSAAFAEAAIDLADVVLYMTERDFPALADRPLSTQRLAECRPFIDPGRRPRQKRVGQAPFRLLTVAMMREGDKLASYETLAAALDWLQRPDWRLDIVGDGPARDRVAALFARFGDRVRFHGQLTGEDALSPLYQQSDLFLWPGVGEAYGMVYLEAKAMETAVVAEDRPGVRDVLRGGGARLVPVDRPDLFAEAVAGLLADPAALVDLGRAGRADVVAHMSVEARAEQLWSLFNRTKLVDLAHAPKPTAGDEAAARDRRSLN